MYLVRMRPIRNERRTHAATGTYRLDAESAALLGATLLHLVQREHDVIGRYGHHGFVTGSMSGCVLNASLRDLARHGSLTATFNDAFTSVVGTCRFNGDEGEYPCVAHRVVRRRKRDA